ncbi:hypothetical protein K9L05_01585 [Candidatus Babeliales bacterium]|nr:hypothetical protein [Candidatus Babeliales bacterium]MCF7899323.1 hypothetical protein [Candidatus Babeliales bacterium]
MINNFVKNKTKKILTLTLLASFICASSNVFAVKNSAFLPVDTTGRKAKHTPSYSHKKSNRTRPQTPSIIHADSFTQTTPARPTTPIETQTDLEISTKMELDQPTITTNGQAEATVSQETQPAIIPVTIIEQSTEQVNGSVQKEVMNLENPTPTLKNPTSPVLGQQALRLTQPSRDPEDPRDPRRGTPGIQKPSKSKVKKFITEIPRNIWMFIKKHPLLTFSGVTIVATATGYCLVPSFHNAINSGVHNLGVFAFNKLGQFTGEMQRLQNAHQIQMAGYQDQTALQQSQLTAQQIQITNLQSQLTNAIQHPQCPSCPQVACPTCPPQIQCPQTNCTACPTPQPCPAQPSCPNLHQQLSDMSLPHTFAEWLGAKCITGRK